MAGWMAMKPTSPSCQRPSVHPSRWRTCGGYRRRSCSTSSLALAYVAVSAAVVVGPGDAGDRRRARTRHRRQRRRFRPPGLDTSVVVIVVLPLGGHRDASAFASHVASYMCLASFHRGAIESVGWEHALLAISVFLAGVVLYTPQALSLALNTDHPVAAVSSSTMEPAIARR